MIAKTPTEGVLKLIDNSGVELQNFLKLFNALINGQLLSVPAITARSLSEDKVIY